MKLGGRLALLSVVFIFMVEALILVPALAYDRLNRLQETVDDAALVASALLSTPSPQPDKDQSEILLDGAGVLNISIIRPDRRELLLTPIQGFVITRTVDLTQLSTWQSLLSAKSCFGVEKTDILRVLGQPTIGGDIIDTTLLEQPLCEDVGEFGMQLLVISLGISLTAGAILYFTVRRTLVRPILRVTGAITGFEGRNEERKNLITVKSKIFEIRAAETSLRDMQTRLLATMGQQERLANLGESVSKIQHDLRNILSTAQMVADNLEMSADPKVQKSAPRLVRAIDRAIALSTQTLEYGRAGERKINLQSITLKPFVDELMEEERENDRRIVMINNCHQDLIVHADQDFLRRILRNLIRNAREVLIECERANNGKIIVDCLTTENFHAISVADNGPGINDTAREHLFMPFKGSTKIQGTGLGLAISHELAQAMGGELSLADSTTEGTIFDVILPKIS